MVQSIHATRTIPYRPWSIASLCREPNPVRASTTASSHPIRNVWSSRSGVTGTHLCQDFHSSKPVFLGFQRHKPQSVLLCSTHPALLGAMCARVRQIPHPDAMDTAPHLRNNRVRSQPTAFRCLYLLHSFRAAACCSCMQKVLRARKTIMIDPY